MFQETNGRRRAVTYLAIHKPSYRRQSLLPVDANLLFRTIFALLAYKNYWRDIEISEYRVYETDLFGVWPYNICCV
jgi:hypothetical protein